MMESYRHIIIHYNNPYVNISVALYDDRLKKIFHADFLFDEISGICQKEK